MVIALAVGLLLGACIGFGVLDVESWIIKAIVAAFAFVFIFGLANAVLGGAKFSKALKEAAEYAAKQRGPNYRALSPAEVAKLQTTIERPEKYIQRK
jgi:hypothetical protein